MIRTNSTIQCS